MSFSQSQSKSDIVAPEPSSDAVQQLTIEAGKYVGKSAGDTLPVTEIREQAKANGYESADIDRLLVDAGISRSGAVTIPRQEDLLGELWRVESSDEDNRGASIESDHDSDADKWTDRPVTQNDECDLRPLNSSNSDYYDLREPITEDADLVDKDRYLDDDNRPLTHFDAVGSYIEQRHSESTSAKRYGWTKGRQYYAKQQYKRGMGFDRQLLAEYDNPTTVLLSLRISPPDAGRLTMLTALKTAADVTIKQMDYQLCRAPDAPFEADEWEYMTVFASTEKRATPHLHIYVWIDGDVSRVPFQHVVNKFVNRCQFAPDDGTGNDPNDGAVRVRGNGDERVPRVDDGTLNPAECEYTGRNSRGAVYILQQLPHLREVDKMAQDELLHSATADAWGGQPFRASMSESDLRDEFLIDGPVLSRAED